VNRARPAPAPPRGFADDLRKEQPSLVAEIVREIRGRIPEYDRPLDSDFSIGLVLGVETALAEFADTVDEPAAPPARRSRVYRALGRTELAEGRSMDSLQSACRLGGRLAWRRYARVARRSGMRPEQMADLAEAVFAHVDQICTASVLGYAQAKADAGEAQDRRRRLLDLLLAGAPRETLELAADAADWALPEQVACAALAPAPALREEGRQAGHPRRLTGDILGHFNQPQPFILIPDPGVRLRAGAVADLLRERRAVVGPAVALRDAADSLRWARTARARLPEAVLAGAPVFCDRHLPALLLLGDEPLVKLIGDRRLAPLAGLTAKQRDRLQATLLAWLDTNRGSAPQVAARLGVHPQTARTRLHRVQELFGPALAEPESRFEIEVALRGRLMFSDFADF
jgi:PucR C-terminal helix-turn-helix domain